MHFRYRVSFVACGRWCVSMCVLSQIRMSPDINSDVYVSRRYTYSITRIHIAPYDM